MHLSELKSLHVSKLLDWAIDLGIENANRMRKQELMFAILKNVPKKANRFLAMVRSKFSPMALASYVARKHPTLPALMTFIFLPLKFAASTFTLVTPLKAKCVLRKKANVILLWSK